MSDDRIEVILRLECGSAGPGEWLVADPSAFADHPALCACCGGRSPFAVILADLFMRRARGDIGFFRTVVAVADARGLRAARVALRSDLFLRSRFREASTGGEGRVD